MTGATVRARMCAPVIMRYGTVTVDPMSLFAVVGDSSARRVAGASR